MKRVVAFTLALVMVIAIASVCFAAKTCKKHSNTSFISRSNKIQHRVDHVWTTNCSNAPGHGHDHWRPVDYYTERWYCNDCHQYFEKTVDCQPYYPWNCSYK